MISFFISPVIDLAPITHSPLKTNIFYLDQLIDFGFRYALQIGITALLIPLGYILLICKQNKTIEEAYILIALLLMSPLLTEPTYIFYLILPILIIFTAYAVKYLYERNINRNTNYKKIIIFSILIIMIISPVFIQIIPSDGVSTVSYQTVTLTKYLDKSVNKAIVCNQHQIYCEQIVSFSNNKILALSTASELMNTQKYNLSNIAMQVGLKKAYIIKDPVLDIVYYPGIQYGYLMLWNAGFLNMKKIIAFNNIGYIVDSNNADSNANRDNINKKFGNMNQIYDNGLQQIKVIN
jgi:hypothetical protein